MMMKILAYGFIGVLLSTGFANAQTIWQVTSVAVSPLNAPKVVAATDKMLSSDVGKQLTGRVLLQGHLADGQNPATHSFVAAFKSTADFEAYSQKLQSSDAYNEFLGSVTQIAQPVSTARYLVVDSWGDYQDSDNVWQIYLFDVQDPGAFLEAIHAFRDSATGKKFPGQVHVAAAAFAGISPVSHIISVGFASQAEMAAWNAMATSSADWEEVTEATGEHAEFLGAALSVDIKEWGSTTIAELAAK